jgi:hypothetical protein
MALIRVLGTTDALERATFDFLLGWLGHRPVFGADDPRPALGPIQYGAATRGPAIPRDPRGPLVWQAVVDPAAPVLPFDIVAATARLLADDGLAIEAPDAFDRHGRLRHDRSLAATDEVRDRPVVDQTVELLGRWLQRQLGVDPLPRWPAGRRAVVGLSHDVDHPDAYATLRAIAANPLRLRSAPRTLAARALSQARSRVRDPHPNASWTFCRVVNAEARHGFRSTWFFAATPFHGPWGTPLDVAYDIGERRFQPVFALLRDTGAEIGLHTGYAAHQDPNRIRAERDRLAAIAGTDVAGNRHHYWHLGPQPAATLRAHEAAGFAYDSSIAFNDAPGLRRLGSLPFHPFDATLDRPLRVMQLPVLVMDAALFGGTTGIDDALRRFDAALARVVAAGGVAILDWHAEVSVARPGERRAWGTVYEEILALLGARDDLWVTDLHALASFAADRLAAVRSLGSTP